MIVDAHVHLIDPGRPQGVPFPDPSDELLYRPTLPHHLRATAGRLGVSGAIAIEWSTWVEDNQWLLDLADADPFVVGVVGNLAAGSAGFGARLARFARHPRFVGIRAGTPWCPLDLADRQFVADLQLLAQAGLALDAVAVGGGGMPLLENLLALTERIPTLKVVIDHLPFAVAPEQRTAYERALRELGSRPGVYAKISNVLPRTGPVSADPEAYRPILDQLTGCFAPERVVYASNWPVSGRVAPYERALAVVDDYFTRAGPERHAQFFSTNAQAAYRRA